MGYTLRHSGTIKSKPVDLLLTLYQSDLGFIASTSRSALNYFGFSEVFPVCNKVLVTWYEIQKSGTTCVIFKLQLAFCFVSFPTRYILRPDKTFRTYPHDRRSKRLTLPAHTPQASIPIPPCLNPPNGTFECKLFTQLIHAVPALNLCAVLIAQLKFCVNTAAASL